MGFVKIEFFKCDVCGRKTENHYFPDSWHKYQYSRSWQSGSHKGAHEKEFIACFKCVDSKSVFRKMLNYLKAAR